MDVGASREKREKDGGVSRVDGGDSDLSEASQDPSFQLGCTALL